MKYKSELIKEMVDSRGHEKSSLHYQSECVETWIEENKGAYPKLCDYESEWLNYIIQNPIGEFPYETISTNTTATVNNVVPFAYQSAILKGNTKYRDIETGDILDTFDETKNLELVSVRMPVLMTTGKNLFNENLPLENGYIDGNGNKTSSALYEWINQEHFVDGGESLIISYKNRVGNAAVRLAEYGETGFIKRTNLASNKAKITLTANTKRVILSVDKGTSYFEELQIEYGTAATIYEPYKTNILTVNEEVVLRKVGDVADTLDCNTGEYVQRVGETVFDGGEAWTLMRDNENENIIFSYAEFKQYVNINTIVPAIPMKCDKVNPSTHWNDTYSKTDSNGIVLMNNQKGCRIGLMRTENVTNVAEFKAWLKNNPITIQYELATESIKTVDLTVTDQDGNTLSTIKPIEGTMHITPTGEPIAPTAVLEIPVEAVTQNLASFIEEE